MTKEKIWKWMVFFGGVCGLCMLVILVFGNRLGENLDKGMTLLAAFCGIIGFVLLICFAIAVLASKRRTPGHVRGMDMKHTKRWN